MIVVEGLTVKVNRKTLLTDASFEVPDGETRLLLGQNGVGKTTTIKSLLGFHPSHWRINNVPQDTGFETGFSLGPSTIPRNLRPIDLVRVLRDKKCGGQSASSLFLEYFESWHLSEFLKRPMSQLSLGTKHKVALIFAFCRGSEKLILDEPYIGLDFTSISHLNEAISKANARGVSVLLSSHLIQEAREVATDSLLFENQRISLRPLGVGQTLTHIICDASEKLATIVPIQPRQFDAHDNRHFVSPISRKSILAKAFENNIYLEDIWEETEVEQ